MNSLRARAYAFVILVVGLGLFAGTSRAGTLYLQQCYNTPGWPPGFTPLVSPFGFVGGAASECPNTTGQPENVGIYVFGTQGTVGSQASWTTAAPPGITITHAWLPGYFDTGLNNGGPWGGGFFWAGGGAQVPGAGQNFSFNSPYFGWRIVCGRSSGCSGFGEIGVWQLQLTATEIQGPQLIALGADNLWYQTRRWVRGSWPITFQASDPSGVCGSQAVVDGQGINGPQSVPSSAVWHQCPDQTWNQSINTANYPDGPMQLTLSARNAAGVTSSPSTTLSVDNTKPTIALAGPTDAATTAGVQYVNALAATSGPSGIAGIGCSEDGAPLQWYPGAAARVPVQGLGVHRVACWSSNNARDASGALGTSTAATWSLSIREPAVSTISFARVVDALRCKRARERVRVPAHWVTVPWHGQQLRVRIPAQTRTITVVHCHPLIVLRRVRIHGRWRTERVVLLPHTVNATSRHVAYGAATTIRGWLGTSQGNAIGNQLISIMTAPDNGQLAFRQSASAITAADGGWSARLPPGPSRLVEALYGGAVLTEPAWSTPARVDVAAKVHLSIVPRDAHWGSTITISGQLLGGYVPPAGEVLFVRLKFNGKQIEVEHVRTDQRGRFRTAYTFLGGAGTATYPFWVTTVPESDYPYTAGSSRRINVTVSP